MGESCPLEFPEGHNYVISVWFNYDLEKNIDKKLNEIITREEEKGATLENIVATSAGPWKQGLYILIFYKSKEEPEGS